MSNTTEIPDNNLKHYIIISNNCYALLFSNVQEVGYHCSQLPIVFMLLYSSIKLHLELNSTQFKNKAIYIFIVNRY